METVSIKYPIITRIPGGNIVVVCERTFLSGDKTVTLSGVGESATSVAEARALAESAAHSDSVPAKVLHAVAKRASKVLEAHPEGIPKDVVTKLDKPVEEEQQKKISDLCESLGISNIDVTGWSLGEALVVYQSLKELVE